MWAGRAGPGGGGEPRHPDHRSAPSFSGQCVSGEFGSDGDEEGHGSVAARRTFDDSSDVVNEETKPR